MESAGSAAAYVTTNDFLNADNALGNVTDHHGKAYTNISCYLPERTLMAIWFAIMTRIVQRGILGIASERESHKKSRPPNCI